MLMRDVRVAFVWKKGGIKDGKISIIAFENVRGKSIDRKDRAGV